MITEPVPVSPHDTLKPADHANPRGLLADSRFSGQDGGGAVPFSWRRARAGVQRRPARRCRFSPAT